jgi:RHH-type rel operon transcriptional repressor/antitoxin RelB
MIDLGSRFRGRTDLRWDSEGYPKADGARRAPAGRPLWLAKNARHDLISLMLSVRLTPEIETRLQRVARMTGYAEIFVARQAIVEHIAEFERFYLSGPRRKASRKAWSPGK